MPVYNIIDTFPAFLKWWGKARHLTIEEQITGWEQEYLAPWTELLDKQVKNYAEDKVDWRQIARDRIFPHLPERLPAMQEAHDNLLLAYQSVYARAMEKLGFDFDVNLVIYAGIGCGAGWATDYEGLPAVLLGTENIAECGWSSLRAVKGLIAHELGHLIHYHWRAQQQKPAGSGPWWQLYEEGFAERAESLITGLVPLHQQSPGWLEWCRQNRGRLAKEFLKAADEGKTVAPFFGSWYKMFGKSETGYYLGYEAIKELELKTSFKDLALLEDYKALLKLITSRLVDKN